MTLYHGGNKIKSDNEFGVFYGNRAIKKIYKGSTLVYEVGTIFEATSGSKTVTLPEGNYYLILVGGGGGAGQVTGNVSEGGPGGSGACVKLKVHLMPGTYTLNGAAAGITGYDGTAGGTASIILNGTTLASAGGGGGGQHGQGSLYAGHGYGGAAGVYNISSSLAVLQTVLATNGIKGTDSYHTTQGVPGKSVANLADYPNAGRGSNPRQQNSGAGYCLLQVL